MPKEQKPKAVANDLKAVKYQVCVGEGPRDMKAEEIKFAVVPVSEWDKLHLAQEALQALCSYAMPGTLYFIREV